MTRPKKVDESLPSCDPELLFYAPPRVSELAYIALSQHPISSGPHTTALRHPCTRRNNFSARIVFIEVILRPERGRERCHPHSLNDDMPENDTLTSQHNLVKLFTHQQ